MPRYYEGSMGPTDIVIPDLNPTRYTKVNGEVIKTGCRFGKCPDRFLYLSHPQVLESIYNSEGN